MSSSPDPSTNAESVKILKSDLFGQIRFDCRNSAQPFIVRDTSTARRWLRPLARKLAAREARILSHLPEHAGLPRLLDWNGDTLSRSYVDGLPMQEKKPSDIAYFRSAHALLRKLHRAGVVHNDSAKEPNWLVLPDGTAGLIDFQLSGYFVRRTRLFRSLAREDLRHLLKHKRSYLPDQLTTREQKILDNPASYNRLWRATGKKVYVFVTRRLLNWRDREGANDRTF